MIKAQFKDEIDNIINELDKRQELVSLDITIGTLNDEILDLTEQLNETQEKRRKLIIRKNELEGKIVHIGRL